MKTYTLEKEIRDSKDMVVCKQMIFDKTNSYYKFCRTVDLGDFVHEAEITDVFTFDYTQEKVVQEIRTVIYRASDSKKSFSTSTTRLLEPTSVFTDEKELEAELLKKSDYIKALRSELDELRAKAGHLENAVQGCNKTLLEQSGTISSLRSEKSVLTRKLCKYESALAEVRKESEEALR